MNKYFKKHPLNYFRQYSAISNKNNKDVGNFFFKKVLSIFNHVS